MQGRAGLIRATAFLTRSIRQESRLMSHHVMRGVLTVVILGLFAIQLSLSAMTGAAGYNFADTITSTSYWFLTIVGSLYFCVAITEEKEEDTLPLIRMTGVSSFALLIGKSLPRLAMAILFLLVISPFIVLSITMGGVLIDSLLVCLWGMLCYAFLLSQIGLLCSVISRESQRAVALSCVAWLCFEFGHVMVSFTSYALLGWDAHFLAEQATAVADFLQQRSMVSVRGDYLSLVPGDSLWQPQMTWHLSAGVVCFVCSLLLFDVCATRAASQGNPGDISHRLPFWRKTTRASARAMQPALAWKSWYFISGGLRWFLLKLIGLPAVTVGVFVLICTLLDESLELEPLGVFMMVIGVAALVVDTGRSMGRVLNEEIFRKTIGSLLILPRTVTQILYPLMAGLLPVMIPPVICFLLGIVLLCSASPIALNDFSEVLGQPWVWHFLSWFALTMHLGVLLSTVLRYGGMLIAIAIMWIAAPTLFFMCIMLIAFLMTGAGAFIESFMQYILPLGLIMGELLLCLGIQRMVILRLQSVGQQA